MKQPDTISALRLVKSNQSTLSNGYLTVNDPLSVLCLDLPPGTIFNWHLARFACVMTTISHADNSPVTYRDTGELVRTAQQSSAKRLFFDTEAPSGSGSEEHPS